jgi:hypothetical protein
LGAALARRRAPVAKSAALMFFACAPHAAVGAATQHERAHASRFFAEIHEGDVCDAVLYIRC